MVLRLVRLVERRGLDAELLLERAALTRVGLEAASARISYADADHLMELAAAELGANGLGIELALTSTEETYGAAGMLLVTAATFRQGLSRSLAYQRLWGDGERFALSELPRSLAVRFRHPGPGRLAAAVAAECALCEVLEGVRALVERDAVPDAVELAHAPLGDVAPLFEQFGVEPRFEQAENRIVLGAELVDRPMHAVRDLLGAAMERQAARALALLPHRDNVRARVEPLLTGEAGLSRSLDEVAAALHQSPRTLQRKLRGEGTSFQALLDEARRRAAEELERQGVPFKEITFRLGFQDPSAFLRARRRWRT
ncbi:MAG TPA: AraC family transcriptional regulator ligand-binding domain-containing protein [Polyangiaceae bacterium]|nr:AraC family transcriptional regulator ligand-binding domain-containing protein [Polyangiaceae bacterium]